MFFTRCDADEPTNRLANFLLKKVNKYTVEDALDYIDAYEPEEPVAKWFIEDPAATEESTAALE